MAKSNLILEKEWHSLFCELPDEDAGKLIKAAFMCHEGEPVSIDDPVLQAVYSMVSRKIKENAAKYEQKCEQNARNRSAKSIAENKTEEPLTTVNDRKQSEVKEKEKVKVKEKKNKDMSGKPDSPPLMVAVRQIVDHLNEKAGTKYMASSRATVELIKARMNERWTVEDHIKVIDNMTAAWKGDPKMEEYLRPSTLFARAHFEEYLNRKPTARTGTNKFQNFPARQDQQHKDMVAQIIAMNAGGKT